jgi:hypothetical protein
VKVYRGSAAAARNYLDADRSRADDYYLAEGSGIARRFVTGPDGCVVELASLTGDGYDPTSAKLAVGRTLPRRGGREFACGRDLWLARVRGDADGSVAVDVDVDVDALWCGRARKLA